MDKVADGLYVGTVDDAGQVENLREVGITTIISLIHRSPTKGYPDEVAVHSVPLRDGPQNDISAFEEAVEMVLSERENDTPLLIHCSAGSSRSPAVAATALALSDDIGLEAAFDQIATRRPAVDPHEALVRRAAEVYNRRRLS